MCNARPRTADDRRGVRLTPIRGEPQRELSTEHQLPAVRLHLQSIKKRGKEMGSFLDVPPLKCPVRCRGSERTSPEERGPVEVPLRRKAETERVREGISEGFRSAEPERVAQGGVGAVELRHRVCLNKSFQARSVSSSMSLGRIVAAADRMNRDTTCRSVRPLLSSRNGEACTVRGSASLQAESARGVVG